MGVRHMQKTEMIRRGLLAVYKPPGITSSDVTQKLKQTLLSQLQTAGVQPRKSYSPNFKVGHGGTLDKFAEGILVIGIGEDCKQLRRFQNNTIKSYEVIGRLGVTTDSLDCDGAETESKEWTHITTSMLEHALQSFHGETTQSAPLYSALKYKGRSSSDYAREAKTTGITIDIPPKVRLITISSLTLKDFSPPSFSVAVTCSSGTYMRSLVRDIAESLDTVGYVTHLCRTAVGPFTLQHALRADTEEEELWSLESIKSALRHF